MPGSIRPQGNLLFVKEFANLLSTAPTSVGGNTTSDQTFTVNGVLPNDYLNCQYSGVQTTGVFVVNVRVTAANTVVITFANITASPATPGNLAYGFVWGRPEAPLPIDAT